MNLPNVSFGKGCSVSIQAQEFAPLLIHTSLLLVICHETLCHSPTSCKLFRKLRVFNYVFVVNILSLKVTCIFCNNKVCHPQGFLLLSTLRTLDATTCRTYYIWHRTYYIWHTALPLSCGTNKRLIKAEYLMHKCIGVLVLHVVW